jgi:hypothetical protein
MLERWEKANSNLPKPDLDDIKNKNPHYFICSLLAKNHAGQVVEVARR